MAIITLNPFDDVYVSGTPGDEINGIGGNDTLTASAGGNRLNGGDGDDVLNGGAGNDVLVGDSASNFIYHNILKGFGGNDVISSLSWLDEVDAGSGDDFVNSYAQQTSQVVDGGTGNDIIVISSLINDNGPVQITMGSTLVCIIGGINGATYMNFESLQVTLGIGANTVTGGNGDDRIYVAYLNGTNATTFFDAGFVKAGGGNDNVAFNGLTGVGTGTERLNGGKGVDRLSWTAGEATIGALTIDAALGTMDADGRTFATFDAFESVSFRTFDAISGAFSYSGQKGIDTLNIGAASSLINTLAGDDYVIVAAGTATVFGGTGNDVLRVDNVSQGAATLHGDSGNDLLLGGSSSGDYFGDDGDDVITVQIHSRAYGGLGGDQISLNLNSFSTAVGPSSADGGAGRDLLTLTVKALSGDIVLDLGAASFTLADGTAISGFEAVSFQSGFGNDSLTASNDAAGAAVNKLFSLNGNDTLRAGSNGAWLDGGSGIDSLQGAAGNDMLNGGLGGDNDILRGAGGNDTLIGGIGRDFLVGGLGGDHFTLAQYYETGTTATTRDQITDFVRAQGDKVDLAAVDAVLLAGAPGDQAFDFVGTAAFGHVAGELRYQKFNLAGTVDDYTLISGDFNGDAIADFTIEVTGLITFIDTDFVL